MPSLSLLCMVRLVRGTLLSGEPYRTPFVAYGRSLPCPCVAVGSRCALASPGISITEKPSMMTMAKLAMDSEVRAVTQKVRFTHLVTGARRLMVRLGAG